MSVFLFYFGWPDGAVWSNLLASVICAVVVWWRLRARMIAHHVEQLAQRERHHRELKEHVTAAGSRQDAAPAPAVAASEVNPVTLMSDQEFGRQLRALMRRNPAEFEEMLRQLQRRSGGRWPRGGA